MPKDPHKYPGHSLNLPLMSEQGRRELIRAWENVLLLDGNDTDAMMYLGVCLVGLNLSEAQESPEKAAQCVAGSRLIQQAFAANPTKDNAATFYYCLSYLVSRKVAPERATEMAQYMVAHPEQCEGYERESTIKTALNLPTLIAGDGRFAKLQAALENAEKDPDTVLIVFPPELTRNGPVAPYVSLLTPYLDSPDPVVRFAVERAMGVLLCWVKTDSAALEHFDRAIAVMEDAYQRCKDHRDSLNNIYRLKIEACRYLDLPDEASRTAWAGARHFRELGRFARDAQGYSPVGWLYRYCVTKAADAADSRETLAICNTYIAAAEKEWRRYEDWPCVCAKREELVARLAGKPVPGLGDLHLIQSAASLMGTDQDWMMDIRMASTPGKLWFEPRTWHGNSYRMVYNAGRHEIAKLLDGRSQGHYVAATGDTVFFASYFSLEKFDTNGKLLKDYNYKDPFFPGHINDICAGGGQIYFAFGGEGRFGIAAMDPATDKVTILAPSSRDAKPEQEPIDRMSRVQWDAVTPRLYVGAHEPSDYARFGPFTQLYGLSPRDNTWQQFPIEDAPRFVISDGDETLLVRVGDERSVFHFVKADETVAAAVPVPTMIGQPAWDHKRIWVPTASGLYEVDRATGQVKWLAYQSDNQFFSALKADGRLYVAARGGLYCQDDPSTTPSGEAKLLPVSIKDAAHPSQSYGPFETAGPVSLRPVIVRLTLEGRAQAELTVTLDKTKVLAKTRHPETTIIDLSAVTDRAQRIEFQYPGYTPLSMPAWEIAKQQAPNIAYSWVQVGLFRPRYVVLRCAFNTRGGRRFDGSDVEEQRVALSIGAGPKYFCEDWRIEQVSQNPREHFRCEAIPCLYFERFPDGIGMVDSNGSNFSDGFGICDRDQKLSYETMVVAPESDYHYGNLRLKKGAVFYCRVRGNVSGGLGYGKVLVEDVTEARPGDIQVINPQ